MKHRGYSRKFHQRNGQTRRVNEPLWKADREIETFERPTARAQSLAEALYLRFLMVCRLVIGILDQPPPVLYRFRRKDRKAFPDVQVRYADGRIELHEIKDARLKDDPELQERITAIASACNKLGKTYRVIFSDECYQQPRRHNVQLILRCREHPGAERFLEGAENFVLSRDRTTLGELKAATGIDTCSFLALVCAGHFEIDLCAPITADTIVMP